MTSNTNVLISQTLIERVLVHSKQHVDHSLPQEHTKIKKILLNLIQSR